MTEQFAWELADLYSSINGQDYQSELARVRKQIAEISHSANLLESRIPDIQADAIKQAGEIKSNLSSLTIILHDLETYADCSASLNGQDQSAQTALANIQECTARLSEVRAVIELFELNLSKEQFAEYLKLPAPAADSFQICYRRKCRKNCTLSIKEEKLIAALGSNGFHSWGRMYQSIAGTVRCQYEFQNTAYEIGLAEASGLLQSNDPLLRQTVWDAVQLSWESNQHLTAGILNAISGWRIELCRKRSSVQEQSVLAEPLFHNRLSEGTLNAMMSALKNNRHYSQNTLQVQAKLMGIPTMRPSDLMAPCPVSEGQSPSEFMSDASALAHIHNSLTRIDPEFGDFINTMRDNSWIETRTLPNKRPGAYCTLFYQNQSPHVYMSFLGGMRDLKVLAHELGHAFHCWAMKDLPFEQTRYPMTLAETASNVGELLLSSHLLEQSSEEMKRQILWQEASDMIAYLLHIPTRFDFESQLYFERGKGDNLNPDTLQTLLASSWENWFGVSTAGSDHMLWASKQHFYLTYLGFYNFPYACGYLLSQRVFEKQQSLGEGFFKWYQSALKDTGCMTFEDFVRKHFDENPENEDFWIKGIEAASRRIQPLLELAD